MENNGLLINKNQDTLFLYTFVYKKSVQEYFVKAIILFVLIIFNIFIYFLLQKQLNSAIIISNNIEYI